MIHRPDGPTPTSEYEHSSVPATVKEIFGLPNFLTKRDAWAGSFLSELSLSEPRTDMPMHLPSPLPPGLPSVRGRRDGREIEDAPAAPGTARNVARADENNTAPRHCSALGTPFKCGHPSRPHKKQRQRMRHWAETNVVPLPDFDDLTDREASEWIEREFRAFNAKSGEDGSDDDASASPSSSAPSPSSSSPSPSPSPSSSSDDDDDDDDGVELTGTEEQKNDPDSFYYRFRNPA